MSKLLNALIFLFIFSPLWAENSSPNIVWIFSDDHTQKAIGAYGSILKSVNPTPNLDRLAKEGMLFERSYVANSICAPSRATLLTGKHSHINGKVDNMGPFNHDQQQFQKILQKNGYQTAMIGKIHLAGKMQGFDYWEVLPGQGSYYNPDFITENGKTSYTGYVADIVTEKSIDWLKNKRDKEKPFMLMVHHKGTHRTWMGAPRHVGLYDDVTLPQPSNLFDDYKGRGTAANKQDMSLKITMRHAGDLKIRNEAEKKEWTEKFSKMKGKPRGEHGAYYRMNDEQRKIWDASYDPRNDKFYAQNIEKGSDEWIRWAYQRYVKDYLRTAKSIDDCVGEVMDYLEKAGLEENTIVIYGSDQGFYLGEHGWFDKRFMYEESFSTPLIAKWPGQTKPGSRNSDLVQNIDYAETFLDMAGVEAPKDMQGESLVPLLKGENPANWRKHLYYHYYEYPHGSHSVRRHEGVTGKRFKLIRFYGIDVPNGEEWEFFDLKNDPDEMQSQYSNPEYAAEIAKLKKELQNLRDKYEVVEVPQKPKKKRK
ncbi:mucin-desulfating sulfatase (N-acetylglucosamine-6-sulfatase) [Lentisphaera araneosa HTCC2155]|jgi:arylsulfatase A-like enzyme|uniref:Mucin-desulfating sulfatase (N-acetylglucosamine-6-sulfatase) n=1 Tax=Lentisphaera araneosa HTCC2155 TaxID=313628 RepID=A6DHU8_9BACT|nr:sulfatase [Lentisphaera araneosa]EDM28602.1 mucin-desulfating sulfatase (N-acetylglucosamine-6-sulfatase) [Lentisphaera araneosa HTCC2155]